MDEMLVDKVCGNIHLSQVYPEINTRTEVIFNMSSSDTTDFTNVKSYCNRVSTIDENGNFDAEKTDKVLSKKLEQTEKAVIPSIRSSHNRCPFSQAGCSCRASSLIFEESTI